MRYRHILKAAANEHCVPQTLARIRQLVEDSTPDSFFATGILRQLLEQEPTLREAP